VKNILFYGGAALIMIVVIGFVYRKPKDAKYKNSKIDKVQTNIKVDTAFIDLGDVKQYSPIHGKYVLHNNGNSDFRVENIMTNCFCTQSEYSKSPVKPKDSTLIVLKYDSTRAGTFQSTGIVFSSAIPKPVLLVLRGNVIEVGNKIK
jgi:signal peptidase I